VSSRTIFKAVLAQASANFILLLIWSLVAPLEWTRVVTDATDNFDRSIESYANCAASDQSLVFVVIILLSNIAFLLIGTFWAYKSRNIATEYNESRYIGISIVAVLQSWTIGLPILIVVRDNPSASFYVQSGLIFVTALAILSFTFVPKVIALHKEASGSKKRQKLYREFVREASLRRRAEEEHSDREPQGALDDSGPQGGDGREDADRPKQGIKIIHNPRVSSVASFINGEPLSHHISNC
jgi:7 transmembrane sweet-taste receptor of 3 GCPR